MRCITSCTFALALAALLLYSLLGPGLVRAQEAGQQENLAGPVRIDRNLIAGNYSLFVEAEASNLSLGTALVSVAVLNAATGEPVPGASVEIHTIHDVTGETGWATALPVPERPEIYRARMKLENPGAWDLSVEIDGPLGREATVVGTVAIPQPKQYWVGSVVFAGMSGVLLCGLLYVLWTIRRAQKQREAANAT
ncbi:MAG: FixH family protein [Chloroflexota bacterium]|nr:FixH family protein [Chloroflexota bacterium]